MTIGSIPRLRITLMYATWAVGVALFAGYGVMTALWQGFFVAFATAGLFEIGSIIWTTLLQELVPRTLLGRVSSLDWLVSTGFVPVSFALTGPAAGWLGPQATIVAGGLLGAVLMGMLLFVPGVRDPEQRPGAVRMAAGSTAER